MWLLCGGGVAAVLWCGKGEGRGARVEGRGARGEGRGARVEGRRGDSEYSY